ncbi:S9 family peptidase [Robiginitalea biformata]|uniref:Proline-specific endopeptidase n=1 Tax=Robiginitalea biformata (strain ATCC BAA-864 / DSM 15991 / KCTC 12146 / HTCC2501) TaxID=313596 RepID=A4CLK8_ROBBH|nr:oligopeptidase B [Robiginitalea biformata]EAR15757.1 oligopeptidase B [Robiginitalea biformata HTCC2501]
MPQPMPPIATKNPHILEIHGKKRVDEYYWLRERESPEVIEYLEAENAYFRQMTAHTEKFREELFQEMKARIREDDTSVPYKLNGYWYITRFEVGKEYPVYTRKKGSLESEEEILFDANQLAAGHDYFDLRGISVSPDNKLAAFGTDTVSRRLYDIRIRNLETGEDFEDVLPHTTGGGVWATDNRTFFYTRKDPETLRADAIFKHRLGTPASEDELVYLEEDETFNTYVYKSKSRKYIIIGSFSTLTSEYRILPADEPEGEFRIFTPRQRGVEYSIYHYADRFFILTNRDGATNFKVMQTTEDQTGSEYWKPFIPHRDAVLVEDLDIFREYYVVTERDNGLSKMRIVRWDGGADYYLPFDNETYVAYPYVNLDFDTENLRYVYNAMTSPYSIVEFNMATRQKTILKEQEVLGGKFQKENYESRRVWATARDGVKVPVSLVYHRETPLDGSSPLLLYGYGSYGSTSDPYFSTVRLSLLDRGFIYAIAHIRGGEYLGRPWYEEGKLLKKMNTFTDFEDCARFLIAEKYTTPPHIYAYGGSAGGLLIGAVINAAPDLFNGVIAAVPFVDVVTTMLDESIPLTTGEYDEWGNPADPQYYEYMVGYSPYDNVREQEYPHMLVTTGLHDSQVQYWEPAKWVARLRSKKLGDRQLFLYTNMDAGHGGASGRFEALRETAMEYAFLLDLEGKVP